MTLKTEVRTISPQDAKELLALNRENRTISDERVTLYACEMLDGNWRLTGEAIKVGIDASGRARLLDGQHRLLACIEAGAAFESLVVEGLTQDVMAVLDTGKTRTPGDTLRFHGVENATSIASIARMVVSYERGLVGTVRHQLISRSQIVQFTVTNERDLSEAYRQGARLRTSLGTITSASGAFVYIACQHDEDFAKLFIERVIAGAHLNRGDPELALRTWMMATGRVQRRAEVHFSAFIRAYVNWWEGRPLVTIKHWASGRGEFPRLELSPRSSRPVLEPRRP